MILEKIGRNKFRTLLIVVRLDAADEGDLQFAEIQCGVASTKGGVDVLNYSVKVTNAGPKR